MSAAPSGREASVPGSPTTSSPHAGLTGTSTTSDRIGRLGALQLQSGFYFYVGSALGPGGVRARLAHHLKPSRRPHWHIDYLRAHTRVEEIWYCLDTRRLEHICLSDHPKPASEYHLKTGQ